MMATAKGIVWNCGGLTNNSSSSSKALFFENTYGTNFDFAVFLETHHKEKSNLPQELLRYEHTHHILHGPANSHTYYIWSMLR